METTLTTAASGAPRGPAPQDQNDIGEDLQRLVHPHDAGDFLHGLLGLAGAVASTVTGLAGDGLVLAGHWLDEGGKGATPLADSGTRLAAAGAQLGLAADRLGRALDELGHGKVKEFLTDATAAINDGVTDVRQLGGVVGKLIGEDWG
jgi:hypothetical protein